MKLLQVIQKVSVTALTGTTNTDYISPYCLLQQPPIKSRAEFQINFNYHYILKTFWYTNKTLCFQTAGWLVVLRVSKSSIERVFSYQDPHLCCCRLLEDFPLCTEHSLCTCMLLLDAINFSALLLYVCFVHSLSMPSFPLTQISHDKWRPLLEPYPLEAAHLIV